MINEILHLLNFAEHTVATSFKICRLCWRHWEVYLGFRIRKSYDSLNTRGILFTFSKSKIFRVFWILGEFCLRFRNRLPLFCNSFNPNSRTPDVWFDLFQNHLYCPSFLICQFRIWIFEILYWWEGEGLLFKICNAASLLRQDAAKTKQMVCE